MLWLGGHGLCVCVCVWCGGHGTCVTGFHQCVSSIVFEMISTEFGNDFGDFIFGIDLPFF